MMTHSGRANALVLLRLTVAGVLGGGGAHLLFRVVTRSFPEDAGRSLWLLGLLGTAEVISAVLFLAPRTTRFGGLMLLATLVAAAVLHATAGERPPAAFLVYAAAIFAVMAYANSAESPKVGRNTS